MCEVLRTLTSVYRCAWEWEQLGSHGSHWIPTGMGMTMTMSWEWEWK